MFVKKLKLGNLFQYYQLKSLKIGQMDYNSDFYLPSDKENSEAECDDYRINDEDDYCGFR
ncbi:hypothetical protein Bhyg_01953 [Pseudolycoriella hygida]|uniref:Uncharacterized protein n=1 Tax=Pseudolycoriella hygida TaxID=35572 RepID=A0A9Q0NAN1_9DIPT|nr:hypothetical protein Bhyg_01953 [Pseudolycoriella hygida]